MRFYQLTSDNIVEANGSCIALLGGGGKTALLHKLANDFAEYYPSVLQSSLTKIAFHSSDNPLILNDFDLGTFKSIIFGRNPLFVIGKKITNEKLRGISESELDTIRHQFEISIFECDGARNKPLKVHTKYDPVVPDFTTHVIIIVGADVVNTKICDGFVHRPELFCKTWNVKPDFQLDIDFICNVLTSKEGYLSKVLDGVNITYFVNKWDNHKNNAKELATTLYKKTGKPSFYGSVQNDILTQVQIR